MMEFWVLNGYFREQNGNKFYIPTSVDKVKVPC